MVEFPKTIYVTRHTDGEDDFLNVHEDLVSVDTDESNWVGTYQLVSTGELVISRTLVPVIPRKGKR